MTSQQLHDMRANVILYLMQYSTFHYTYSAALRPPTSYRFITHTKKPTDKVNSSETWLATFFRRTATETVFFEVTWKQASSHLCHQRPVTDITGNSSSRTMHSHIEHSLHTCSSVASVQISRKRKSATRIHKQCQTGHDQAISSTASTVSCTHAPAPRLH